jgi:hypothetical protein
VNEPRDDFVFIDPATTAIGVHIWDTERGWITYTDDEVPPEVRERYATFYAAMADTSQVASEHHRRKDEQMGHATRRGAEARPALPHIELRPHMLVNGKGEGPWHIAIVGANGETMLPSETYSTKWNAKRAARRVGQVFGLPVRSPV